MLYAIVLLIGLALYLGYIYLRERPPAELPKPTVPASKDEPHPQG